MADSLAHLSDKQLKAIIEGGDFSSLSDDELAVVAGERGTVVKPKGAFSTIDRAARVISAKFLGPQMKAAEVGTSLIPPKMLEPLGAVAGGTAAQVLAPQIRFSASMGAGVGGAAGKTLQLIREARQQGGQMAPDATGQVAGAGARGFGQMLAGATALKGANWAARPIVNAAAKTPFGKAVGLLPETNPFRHGLLVSEQGRAKMAPARRGEYIAARTAQMGARAKRRVETLREQRTGALDESTSRTAFYQQQAGEIKQTQLSQLSQQAEQWKTRLGDRSEAGVHTMQREFLPKLKEASDEFIETAMSGIDAAGNPEVELPTELQRFFTTNPDEPVTSVPAKQLFAFIRGQRGAIPKGARAGKTLFTAKDLRHSQLAEAAMEAFTEEMSSPIRAARDKWRQIAPIRDEFVKRFGLNPEAPAVERGISTIQQGLTGESRDARNVLTGLKEQFGVEVPADIERSLEGLTAAERAKVAASSEMKALEDAIRTRGTREAQDIKTKFLGQARGVAETRREAARTLKGQAALARRQGKGFMGGEFRKKYALPAKIAAYVGISQIGWSALRTFIRHVVSQSQ